MGTKTNMHAQTDTCNALAPTQATRFDDATVTAVMWRGRWCWRGAEVGRAIGYEQGRYLVDKIRGEWATDFREGKDYDVLRGSDLRAFKALSGDSPESGTDRSPAILVLYESGIDKALAGPRASRAEQARRVGRLHCRIRRALGWDGMWRLFPRHRVGELLVAVRAEEVAVERIAAELSHSRQLSLRAVQS